MIEEQEMHKFRIPSSSEVSEENRVYFEKLRKSMGFVPNLFAFFAKNDTALGDFLGMCERKTTLRSIEREVINLVVSEFHGSKYCLAVHTAIAKMNGLEEDEIIEIRLGEYRSDKKLNALIEFVNAMLENKGKVPEDAKDALFAVGYNVQNMIDIVMNAGIKSISNYMYNIAEFEIDFPLADEVKTKSNQLN